MIILIVNRPFQRRIIISILTAVVLFLDVKRSEIGSDIRYLILLINFLDFLQLFLVYQFTGGIVYILLLIKKHLIDFLLFLQQHLLVVFLIFICIIIVIYL